MHIKNPTAPYICRYTTLGNINVSKTSHLRQITRYSVAAYFRHGETVNNQIKKGLLLSMIVKKIKIGEYLAKLQAKT